MDCSLPGSSIHGIFQAGVLEWGAVVFSMRFPTPGDFPKLGIEPMSLASPALAGGFITTVPPRKPATLTSITESVRSLFK